jgi:hypothetical protein
LVSNNRFEEGFYVGIEVVAVVADDLPIRDPTCRFDGDVVRGNDVVFGELDERRSRDLVGGPPRRIERDAKRDACRDIVLGEEFVLSIPGEAL